MLAYTTIDKKTASLEKAEQQQDDKKSNEPQMSGYLVEAIIKKFKKKPYRTHRSAEVCDAGYIAAIVKEMAAEAGGAAATNNNRAG